MKKFLFTVLVTIASATASLANDGVIVNLDGVIVNLDGVIVNLVNCFGVIVN